MKKLLLFLCLCSSAFAQQLQWQPNDTGIVGDLSSSTVSVTDGSFPCFDGVTGKLLRECVDGVDYFSTTPGVSKSADYTTVLADRNSIILHPTSDNNARTFTINSNALVAYPVNTVITFINMKNTVTIKVTDDTIYLAGPGTTGDRTLAAYGVATAIKVSATVWIISGPGLT